MALRWETGLICADVDRFTEQDSQGSWSNTNQASGKGEVD